MDIKLNKLVLIGLFVLFSGCTSFGGAKGVPFSGLTPIESTKSQLYIYRPSTLNLKLSIPTLLIDNQKALSVRDGSYSVYNLPPGIHRLEINGNGNWGFKNFSQNIELLEGKRNFMRLKPNVGYATLESVSENVAVSELNSLLYTGS